MGVTEQERERLRQDIIEGCRTMADVMLETEKEFQPLDEELWRGPDGDPKAGRHRSPSTGSGSRVRTGS